MGPDCTLIGSTPVQLLMGSATNETIIERDGTPRPSDVHPDDRRAPDGQLELAGETCR